MSRSLDLRPHDGPCAMCGNAGPKGLFLAPSGDEICAPCLDDVTGESAAHSLPRPTR